MIYLTMANGILTRMLDQGAAPRLLWRLHLTVAGVTCFLVLNFSYLVYHCTTLLSHMYMHSTGEISMISDDET